MKSIASPSIFRDPDAKCLFWSQKPPNIRHWDWLFSQKNPNRFPEWVTNLLKTIIQLSRITGQTWCYQDFLAIRFGKSVRWIRETLHRLEVIGVIEIAHDRQNRYRFTEEFWTAHTQKGRSRGRSPKALISDPDSNSTPTITPEKHWWEECG